MEFEEALKMLKIGKRIYRDGWNGKRMWLSIAEHVGQFRDRTCRIGESYPVNPFIVIKGTDDKVTPWIASQTDILASDWVVQDVI